MLVERTQINPDFRVLTPREKKSCHARVIEHALYARIKEYNAIVCQYSISYFVYEVHKHRMLAM